MDITEFGYEKGKCLGSGNFGKIFECKRIKDKIKFAVKEI